MKNSPLYTAEDVMRVNSLVIEGRKRIRVDKYVGGGGNKNGSAIGGSGGEGMVHHSEGAGGSRSDNLSAPADTVPEGWQIRTRAGPDANRIEIVAPDGSAFDSRTAALRHMVASGYSTEEQDEMRGHLFHEGWTDSPLVPAGWKVINRSEDDDDDENGGGETTGGGNAVDYTFLTPAAEVLDSVEAAVDYLTENGGSEGEESVKKLQQLQEKEIRHSGRAGAKYDWEDDPTVPAGGDSFCIDFLT